MKVRVLTTAFVNGSRVRPGDIIDFPGGKCPRWAEPASNPAKADSKAYAEVPVALKDSDLAVKPDGGPLKRR